MNPEAEDTNWDLGHQHQPLTSSQGFRMLSGDLTNRQVIPNMKRQNCFRCYTGPNFGGDTAAPCQGGDKYVLLHHETNQ
jgi:hypothetical protein